MLKNILLMVVVGTLVSLVVMIKSKRNYKGYSHQEHNNDMVKDNLEENIKNNKDILGRGYYDYKIVPFDPEEYLRELVLEPRILRGVYLC